MGVETKKMANSLAAAGGSFGERIKSWPERVKTFYNDVRTEMKKVTAPSLQGSAGHHGRGDRHGVPVCGVFLGGGPGDRARH